MNNTVKKIVASITVLTCAVWMMGPGLASALTAEELQVMIDELMTEIEELQDQLTELEGEAVVTIEGVPADFTFETDLKQTNTGDDVKYLQIVLNSDSETQLAESGVGSAGNETSYFGPLTKAAVIKFQEKYTEDVLASWGLTEGTGYVGSTTRAKLNSLLAAAEEEEEEVPEGLTSVSPAADATDVALDTEIEAVFDVALDEDTVNATSVGLVTDTTEVEGTVSYDSDTKTITFTPSEDLAYETEYTVTLTTDITADDEAVLDEDYSWSFTTEEAPAVGPGLTVALSADTPGAMLVPIGASNVEVMKIDFVAGEDATIDGITFKRSGAGLRTDFSDLYIYEGNLALSSGRSINSSQVLEFSNLDIDLEEGETKTLSLVAMIDPAISTSGGLHIFTLDEVDADVEVSGLTITSNTLNIATVTGGTLTVDYNVVSETSVELGDENIELVSFDLDADEEDIEIQRITLNQYGAVDISEIDNMVSEIEGDEVEAEITISGDEITIVPSDPYLIEDGKDATFVLKGDITAGAYIKGGAGTIILGVDEGKDIYGVGQSYGYGAGITLDDSADMETITIKAGELNFSYEGPVVGEIGLYGEDVVLFEFETANANDIQVKNITFELAMTAADLELENLALKDLDSGKIVAGPDDIATASTTQYHTFDDSFIIESGTGNYALIADLGADTELNAEVKVTLLVDVATEAYDLSAKNLDTGEWVSLSDVIPSDQLAGKTQTVGGANLTVEKAPSPASQSYVIGKDEAALVGFVLGANAVSDLKVNKIIVGVSAGETAADDADITVRDIVGSVQLLANDPDPDEGTLLDSESIGTGVSTTITFDGFSQEIKASKQLKVYVVGSIKDSYDPTVGDTDYIRFDITDVEAKDEQNEEPQYNSATTLTTVAGREMGIISSGDLAMTFAGTNPDVNEAVVGGDKVLFSAYNLRPSNEGVRIRDLTIDIATTTTVGYFEGIILNLDGLDEKTDIVMSTTTKLVEDVNLDLTKDEDGVLKLYANLMEVGPILDSGLELNLYLATTTPTTSYDVLGLDSGVVISDTFTSTTIPDDQIRTFAVYKSVPTFSATDVSGTLLNAPMDLYEFTVAADDNGDIKLATTTLTIATYEATTSPGDLQVGSFELYRGTTKVEGATFSTDLVGNGVATSTTDLEVGIPAAYRTIGAGDSYTFTLEGTVAGAVEDDANSISVTVKVESGTYEYGAALTDVPNGIVIWGDTYIWADGAYLRMPTETYSYTL